MAPSHTFRRMLVPALAIGALATPAASFAAVGPNSPTPVDPPNPRAAHTVAADNDSPLAAIAGGLATVALLGGAAAAGGRVRLRVRRTRVA